MDPETLVLDAGEQPAPEAPPPVAEEAAPPPVVAPAAEPAPEAESAERQADGRGLAARDLPRIAARLFGAPLMVHGGKLEVILGVMGPRLGLDVEPAQMLAGPLVLDDPEGAPYDVTADGIAMIAVEGTLVYKSSYLGALSGMTGYGDIGAALDAAVADPAVGGILLAVDSFGGECNGCFDLADRIFAARASKPVFAVAADDAYSAAYALASAADRLFVSRTSGVGSIGVVALHVDQSAADKAEGLKYTYIHAGERKVDGNAHAPLSSPAKAAIQAEVDRMQAVFAGSVAKYRGLSVDYLIGLEAASFFGETSVAAKLADAVGTPADALAALRAEVALRAGVERTGLAAEAPAPPIAPVPEAAPESNVVLLAKIRGETAAKVAADAVEIIAACKLAGFADLAAGFIKSGASLDEVRADLQSRRARASATRSTSGHILPGAGETATDQTAIRAGWQTAIKALPQNRVAK